MLPLDTGPSFLLWAGSGTEPPPHPPRHSRPDGPTGADKARRAEMLEKDRTARKARRKALAELCGRHYEEFSTLYVEIRAELRGETKPAKKTAARQPRSTKK